MFPPASRSFLFFSACASLNKHSVLHAYRQFLAERKNDSTTTACGRCVRVFMCVMLPIDDACAHVWRGWCSTRSCVFSPFPSAFKNVFRFPIKRCIRMWAPVSACHMCSPLILPHPPPVLICRTTTGRYLPSVCALEDSRCRWPAPAFPLIAYSILRRHTHTRRPVRTGRRAVILSDTSHVAHHPLLSTSARVLICVVALASILTAGLVCWRSCGTASGNASGTASGPRSPYLLRVCTL